MGAAILNSLGLRRKRLAREAIRQGIECRWAISITKNFVTIPGIEL